MSTDLTQKFRLAEAYKTQTNSSYIRLRTATVVVAGDAADDDDDDANWRQELLSYVNLLSAFLVMI